MACGGGGGVRANAVAFRFNRATKGQEFPHQASSVTLFCFEILNSGLVPNPHNTF